MIFLIEYDRARGELIEMRSYPDSDRSVAQDVRLERELTLNRSGVSREVVLFEAESEAALRLTHGRYFQTLADLVDSSGLMPAR